VCVLPACSCQAAATCRDYTPTGGRPQARPGAGARARQPRATRLVPPRAPLTRPPPPRSAPDEFGVEVMGVSGSTALVGLIHPTKAIFASLGDCMAVVCRGGVAMKATQQHRVYGIGPDVLEGAQTGAGQPIRAVRLCTHNRLGRHLGRGARLCHSIRARHCAGPAALLAAGAGRGPCTCSCRALLQLPRLRPPGPRRNGAASHRAVPRLPLQSREPPSPLPPVPLPRRPAPARARARRVNGCMGY
jgi:hypothetical protein